MSAVNAYVVMNFSTEFWVDFKLWGYALPLVFLVGQGLYIAPIRATNPPLRIPSTNSTMSSIAEQMHRQLKQTPVHHRPGGDRQSARMQATRAQRNRLWHPLSGADRVTFLCKASRAWPSTALCMMRCRNLLTRASTHSPLKFSEAVCGFGDDRRSA